MNKSQFVKLWMRHYVRRADLSRKEIEKLFRLVVRLRPHWRPEWRICEGCGKDFLPKDQRQRFHQPKCRTAAFRAKQERERAEMERAEDTGVNLDEV